VNELNSAKAYAPSMSAVKSSPIDSAMYALETCLESLSKEVEVLSQMLAQVIVDGPPSESNTKMASPKEMVSQIETRIENQRQTAENILRRVSRLTSTVRL
jgi:mevalonate kinase